MMRTLLALLVFAVGCGKSDSSSTPPPQPQPAPAPPQGRAPPPSSPAATTSGATPASPPAETAAGTVVDLEGQVTARRAEAATERPLAKDAAIYADDTITTSADGSVAILLVHNGVTWTLEGGKSRRVDSSLAWKAPAGSASAGLLAEAGPAATGAAGRHAEAEAAHTEATAKREADVRHAMAEQKKNAGVLKVLGTKGGSPDDVLGGIDSDREGGSGSGIKLGGRGGGSGGGGQGGGAGLGTIGRKPAQDAGRITVSLQLVAGEMDAAVARRVVLGRLPQARACYLRALTANPTIAGTVSVNVAVVANGSVANATLVSDNTDATGLAACFIASARAMRFPALASDTPATLQIVWKLVPSLE